MPERQRASHVTRLDPTACSENFRRALPMALTSGLRRRPLTGYFALTFCISWGGILTVLIARLFDLSAPGPGELGLSFGLMLLGPSVAGVALIALSEGRVGLQELWSRCIRWRVRAVWYTVALLTAPLLLLALLLCLGNFVSPAFAPRFQWALFGAGLVAGGFEEIGWTGFATPHLLARHHAGMAGLWLGLIWSFWHLLVDFRYNIAAMGNVWPLEFAIVYLATLTPYRILMTWVYRNTGSVLVAIVMHASFTGWLLVLFPATSLTQSLSWQTAFAFMLWLAVALALRISLARVDTPGFAQGIRFDVRPKI